jgi:hypothetical protein
VWTYRNVAAFVVGVLSTIVGMAAGAAFAHWWLLDRHPIGRDSETQFVNYSIGLAVVVFPAIAIAVGAIVAAIAARTHWWLAGVSLAPLIVINAVAIGVIPIGIMLGAFYLSVCLGAAFLVSRFGRHGRHQ